MGLKKFAEALLKALDGIHLSPCHGNIGEVDVMAHGRSTISAREAVRRIYGRGDIDCSHLFNNEFSVGAQAHHAIEVIRVAITEKDEVGDMARKMVFDSVGKGNMEIYLPIPVGKERAALIESLKPFFLVMGGNRNSPTHTHLILDVLKTEREYRPVIVGHHNLDEMVKLMNLQRERIDRLEDRIAVLEARPVGSGVEPGVAGESGDWRQ